MTLEKWIKDQMFGSGIERQQGEVLEMIEGMKMAFKEDQFGKYLQKYGQGYQMIS